MAAKAATHFANHPQSSNEIQRLHLRMETVPEPASPSQVLFISSYCLLHLQWQTPSDYRITSFSSHRFQLSGSEHVPKFFDFHLFEAKQGMFDDARNKGDSVETCSAISLCTTNSRASSLLSRPPFGHSSAKDNSEAKVELQTLEEHRFATRFEKKRVTLRTWRKAKSDAYKLIATGDREKLVEALYLLLELIWLRPRGCRLPPLYLNAGSIYLAFDCLDEAANSYRNCLHLDDSSWKARYNLGITLSRAQDFVDAKHQFDSALKICPSKAAHDEIHAMVKEIEEIVQERNGRAFRASNKAREFTSQYLATLHSVGATPSELTRTIISEDYSSSCHSRPPMLSPLLFHKVEGWQGLIAGLLHRLQASAFMQSISLEKEFFRVDATGSGCISIHQFEHVLVNVTGTRASASEHKELARICQNGNLLHQLLVPNSETFAALDVMKRIGAFHTALHWGLTRQRAKRSEKSCQGGFWYWLDLPMPEWIAQIGLPPTFVEQLRLSGCVTPMDLSLKSGRIDPASASLTLSFADRGVFVFECHRARTEIQCEAAIVLQMFFRRLTRDRRRAMSNKCIMKMASARLSTYKKQSSALSDLRIAVSEDTTTEQQIATHVLQCLNTLVDDVVAAIRLERRDYEEKIRWQEIPVRTEKRQATSQAVSMLQNLMYCSSKAGQPITTEAKQSCEN